MKYIQVVLMAAVASALAMEPGMVLGGVERRAGAQTLVLFEVGGIAGNECLTFRNNGEMVDAACVNTAADRQMTQAADGTTLKLQRSFTAGFRKDLVGVEACVGFNGTTFRAEPCNAGKGGGVEMVTLQGGQLKAAGGACASGHDGKAQLTVDPAGKKCATYKSTTVTPSST